MGVTREDVAKLAGVSVATVSYVVNDGPRPVASATRERVLQAIEQLGYQPSAVARSLRTQRTLTVGLVVSDILNFFHSGVAKSVEEAARRAGYTVILCNSDEDPEQELMYLQMLQQKRVDGIILVPTGGNVGYLQSIIDQEWNLVQLDRRLDELETDSIVIDNEPGAYVAVKHLIELGHRRIALIGAPFHLTPGRGRRAGYERALREAGIPIEAELMAEGNFKEQPGMQLTRYFMSLSEPPTALFAANNRLGLGAIEALQEQGRAIPDDVALAVFDDVEYYALLSPRITAVSYSIYDLGQIAFELLLNRMTAETDGHVVRHRSVPCELMVRESTVGGDRDDTRSFSM